MKLLIAFLTLAVVGTAQAQYYNQSSPVSYEELERVALSADDNKCPRIDYWVEWAERQLRLKGLLGRTPEDLDDADRKYNGMAHILIWSMRIGCNNPNRYTK